MRRFFCLLLVVFLLSLNFSFAAVNYEQEIKEYEKEIKGKQSELEKIRKEIEKLDRQKEKSKTQEGIYRREIKKLEDEIGALLKESKRLEREKKETEKKIKITEDIYRSTKEEGLRLANTLKEEMKFFYLWQKTSSVPEKDYYLLALLKQKENYFQATEEKKKEVEKEKESLSLKKREIDAEKERKLLEEKERKGLKKEKQTLLAQTEEERIKEEKEIENLKKAATDLSGFIFNLEKKKKETEKAKKEAILARENFAEKKGYLPWPLEGELVSRFGRQKHPQFNTYVVNNGIKISPKSDKKVSAISSGKVVYAAEFQTYGKMVILDHDGGFYTVYGSLGEILVKEGKEVILGEQLGSLSNEPLYFELRDGGQPVDPLPWLKK